jgi:hypothetical protein
MLRASDDLDEGASLAIAEVTEQQLPRGGRTRSLKLHSKMEALKLLAKHLGIMDNDLNVAIATVRKYGYEIVDNYPTHNGNPGFAAGQPGQNQQGEPEDGDSGSDAESEPSLD